MKGISQVTVDSHGGVWPHSHNLPPNIHMGHTGNTMHVTVGAPSSAIYWATAT